MKTFLSRLVGAALGCAALILGTATACSSSSGSSGPSPFNGAWSCTTTSVFTFTSPASYPAQTYTTKASFDIDVSAGDDVTVAAGSVDGGATLGDGGSGCSVSYATSGDTATLVPNQTCAVTIPANKSTITIDIAYKTGSGTVSGNTMDYSGSYTFSGSAKNGAVSVALAGSVAGSTTCTK